MNEQAIDCKICGTKYIPVPYGRDGICSALCSGVNAERQRIIAALNGLTRYEPEKSGFSFAAATVGDWIAIDDLARALGLALDEDGPGFSERGDAT